jgi:hypothetical protein
MRRRGVYFEDASASTELLLAHLIGSMDVSQAIDLFLRW